MYKNDPEASPQPGTMLERVARQAAQSPSLIAVRSAEGAVSYSALMEEAASIRQTLPSEVATVAIAMGNEPRFVASLLGIWAAGAVAVPFDTRLGEDELRDLLWEHPVDAVVVADTTPAAVAELCAETSTVLGPTSPRRSSSRGMGANIHGCSPALKLLTSGSTGTPKVVVHTHHDLMASTDRMLDHRRTMARRISPAKAISLIRRYPSLPLRAVKSRKQLGWMTPMGLHTISGITVLLQALTSGGRVALTWPFRVSTTWDMIQTDATNILATTPSMLRLLLDCRPQGAGESLLVVGVGAAPVWPSLVSDAARDLGCPVVVGYGSTELCGGVFTTDPWDPSDVDDVGSSVKGVEWEIVDEAGRRSPIGAPGELHVRSTQRHGQCTTCDSVQHRGSAWHHTGDVAVETVAGRVRIVGRVDDMIQRGGVNVYPIEVEHILLGHDDVFDCAVVGKALADADEVIEAFVVIKPGSSVTSRELADWLKPRTAAYKVPDRFHFVDRVPRTLAGTVERYRLR